MQLAGRNAIYFNESWSEGLDRLLKVLRRDAVPTFAEDVVNLGEWVRDQFSEGRRPLPIESKVTTNVCPVCAFPETVWFYEFKAPFDARKPTAFRGFIPWPSFMHNRLLGTFATPDEVITWVSPIVEASVRASVRTVDFIKGGCNDPSIDRRTARGGVVSMLRQAWEEMCRDRNLRPLEMSSGTIGWFHPAIAEQDKVFHPFVDLNGKKRKKALNGVQKKRGAEGQLHIARQWHYAPSARFSVSDESTVTLVSHVAFTTDGKHPDGDAKKNHRTRRSFCKSWYNEQWRTLHLAYVASLRGDGGDIVVLVSPDQVVTVDARPWSLTSPASFEPPPLRRRTPVEAVSEATEPETSEEAVPDEDQELDPADEQDDWDAEDEE